MSEENTLENTSSGARDVFSKLVDKTETSIKQEEQSILEEETETEETETEETDEETETEETETEETDEETETESDTEDGEDEDEETEDEETEEGEEEDEVSTKPKKSVTVVTGDGEELKLDPASKITVMVDGKEEVVNIHDAISSYSGQKVINKRLTEIGEQKKTLEKTISQNQAMQTAWNTLSNQVDEVFDKVKKGEGLEAYTPLIEYFGKYENPVDWEMDMVKAVYPIIQQLTEMTPEERQGYYAQKKLNYYEKAKKEKADGEVPKQKEQRYFNAIAKLRENHNINDSEWTEALQYVKNITDKNRWADFGIDNATPEIKIQFAVDATLASRAKTRAYTRLNETIPGIKKQLGQEKFDKLLLNLSKIVRKHEDLSDDEIDSLITDAVGTSGSATDADKRNLKRKLSKAKLQAKNSAKPKNTIKTFDELKSFADRLKG
jgi:hypothetical protein